MEIKKANERELETELTVKREALSAFRFGIAGSKTKNVKEGKGLRKEIARILTELHERKSK